MGQAGRSSSTEESWGLVAVGRVPEVRSDEAVFDGRITCSGSRHLAEYRSTNELDDTASSTRPAICPAGVCLRGGYKPLRK